MKLQILVNHYKEDMSIVDRFFSSLAKQKDVVFDVILCTDGGEKLNTFNLIKYNLNIEYAYATHSGVCHTRNLMMDYSTADYIMFCDIDDMFFDSNGLKTLIEAAERTNADVIGSPYYAEYINDYFIRKSVYEKDIIRVHGKIFKRNYLIQNNIRFPDEMETSGDMMFLYLAYALTNNIVWTDKSFYIWKWNENSVTRQSKWYTYKTYDKTLKCYKLLANDLVKRNRQDLYNKLISALFGMVYVDMSIAYINQVPEEYKKHATECITEFVSKHLSFYKTLNNDIRKSGYDSIVNYKQCFDNCGSFEDMIPFLEKLIETNESDISKRLENIIAELRSIEQLIKGANK